MLNCPATRREGLRLMLKMSRAAFVQQQAREQRYRDNPAAAQAEAAAAVQKAKMHGSIAREDTKVLGEEMLQQTPKSF
jgi:protein-L-isoaspartate O-methyltransferase